MPLTLDILTGRHVLHGFQPWMLHRDTLDWYCSGLDANDMNEGHHVSKTSKVAKNT